MKVSVCNKICNECAFNGSTENTLYAEFYSILKIGKVFPCHKYLESKTGNESFGIETLDEVKVCRGYVAFVYKYGLVGSFSSNYPSVVPLWIKLLSDINQEELKDIKSLSELKETNIGLKENIFLGN